ncbi:hypothetical protein BV25DRAFT_1841613 [Artomyces pyxidatus]|uniref:Uncharacterized protein n=1 Tax=Artomyces pyxidatus TaxID=48021 RepID=A0ACB8SM18_9AGAM|nr:hypothetical protein BV25DRAFT_1841613 [Artomyces pyxidatus]
MSAHTRYFPPLTNRHVFSPERSPSPCQCQAPSTLRRVFSFERPARLDTGSDSKAGEPQKEEKHGVAEDVADIGERVPKPSGPLSKPGSGGYSLSEELGWSHENYRSVQKTVQTLCKDHLNPTKNYTDQDEEHRKIFLKDAAIKLPELGKYEGQWPVISFAEMYLKNTSSVWRKTKNKG